MVRVYGPMIPQHRNGPLIADRSSSTPYANYHSTGRGSEALEACQYRLWPLQLGPLGPLEPGP